MNRINKFTTQDKNNLLSKTFYALPDNPSDKQFSASQIKKKGYEGYLVLMDFINEVIDALNANVDLSNEQVTTINNAISELQSYFSSGKALRAISDEEGANIRTSYLSSSWGLYAQELTNKMTLGIQLHKGDGTLMDNHLDITGASIFKAGLLVPADKAKIDSIASDIANALAEAKAYALFQDMNKVSKSSSPYVVYVNEGSTPSAIPYSVSPISNYFPLRDADGDILVPIFPSSSRSATSRGYVDDNINSATKRTALVSKLGEASISLNGLMSAQDKLNLDTLMSLLGNQVGDVDSFVNTIREVLEIFNQYPEGQSLVNALALKFDKADVVDALNSSETTKALSANQGKVLKELVDTKANSSDVYDKTYIDNAIDGFVFADIDEELDAESEDAIMNKAVVAGLEVKANKDGNYPTLTAGKAEAIASNREIDDAEIACPPITFGIAGDEAEIQTGINNLEYLEGKSVKFNQLVKDQQKSVPYHGTAVYENGVCTYTFTSDGINDAWGQYFSFATIPDTERTYDSTHKYLCFYKIKVSRDTTIWDYPWRFVMGKKYLASDGWKFYSFIRTGWDYGYNQFAFMISSAQTNGNVIGDTVEVTYPRIFDLTEMFGAGNEPTSYEEFAKRFPLIYYAPDAGSILSSKSYQLVSRGKNQFSALNEFIPVIGGEEYEISGISAGGVLYQYDASKNLIATSDTFTDTVDIEMEENTAFVKISATTYEDIMFYLTFPEDGGVYGEPYVAPRVETIDLPNIELRSVGNVKDIAYAEGGGKRRVGIINLGDLTWTYKQEEGKKPFFYSYGEIQYKITGSKQDFNCLISKRYTKCAMGQLNIGWSGGSNLQDKELTLYYAGGYVAIKDSSYTSASDFKEAVNGIYLLYELKDEEDIPLSENPGWTDLVFVDNYGTLEFTTSPAQVPQVEQPYFIRYTVSLVEFVDTAYVKAKGDGNNIATQEEVDEMKAGNVEVGLARVAENISPYSENSGAEDTSAFTFQTAGGDADIGATAELRALRGKTIKWNQKMAKIGTGTAWTVPYGGTLNSITNGVANITVTADGRLNAPNISLIGSHKYLVKVKSNTTNLTLRLFWNGQQISLEKNGNIWSKIIAYTSGSNTNNYIYWFDYSAETTLELSDYQIFDLTEIFGAGNEPTSVAEFNRSFPKPYYEYNAGELLSAKSNGYKTVGFNAFDGETENGYINGSGEFVSNSGSRATKNFIKVIAGQTYTCEVGWTSGFTNTYVAEYDGDYNFIKQTNVEHSSPTITLSENTHYVKLNWAVTDVSTACFHLTWDNERDGEYEKYNSETFPLPNVELRSAGSVYDELKPDGTLIRRVGVVDLGTLNWVNTSAWGNNYVSQVTMASGVPAQATTDLPNAMIGGNYRIVTRGDMGTVNCVSFCKVDSSNYLSACVNASKTGAEIKTLLDGVLLYYELAEPVIEQTSNTFQEVTDIDDFGTQEFLSEQEIQVPQGAEFFYPVDYKAFIDTMYNKVEGDADEFVTQEELQTALSTFLSSITGYDASKNQTLKHDDTGEMAWVDDEEE